MEQGGSCAGETIILKNSHFETKTPQNSGLAKKSGNIPSMTGLPVVFKSTFIPGSSQKKDEGARTDSRDIRKRNENRPDSSKHGAARIRVNMHTAKIIYVKPRAITEKMSAIIR